MIRKANPILILSVLALAVTLVPGLAQTGPKVDLAGKWAGYTILGDGSRADFSLILEKAADAYTGKISDDSGTMPEMPIKNVTFKEDTLAFEIDFPDGAEMRLIKIVLKLDGEALKGSWTDPDGKSDIVELGRKK